MNKPFKNKGFTLIEILLALAIIAIALTALLRSSSQNISNTTRIKEKSIHHWVEMQGIAAIQLGLIPIHLNQEISQMTTMCGQKVYWRASLMPTDISSTEKIIIKVSNTATGPFTDELIAYRYVS